MKTRFHLCYIILIYIFSFTSLKSQDQIFKVKDTEKFFLNDVYKSEQKSSEIRSFYFEFRFDENQYYSIDLNGHLIVAMAQGRATIVQQNSIKAPEKAKILYSKSINKNAAAAYIAYEMLANGSVSVQLIAIDRKRKYIERSPIYTTTTHAYDDDTANNKITLRNLNSENDLIIKQKTFYKRPHVHKRDFSIGKLECLRPDLAIINMILHRHCDILSGSPHEYVAGDKTQNKIYDKTGSTNKKELYWTLSHSVLAGTKDIYAGYSASKNCKVSWASVFSTRKPRTLLGRGSECAMQTLDIIVPFLYLTGHSFVDPNLFRRTISNIINTGSSGIPNADPVVENRLIEAVRDVQLETNQIVPNFNRAYQEAVNLYATSLSLENILDGQDISDRINEISPIPSTSRAGINAANPTIIGDYALGLYELPLEGMSLNQFRESYPTVFPRIHNHGEWASSRTPFTARVFSNPNPSEITEIESILQNWANSGRDESSSSDSDASRPSMDESLEVIKLLSEGISINNAILEALNSNNRNKVVVVVYYENRPVSILLSYLDLETRTSELSYALTNPENLRIPYSNMALRGGGQYALQQFIEYCISQNIKLITTTAVTTVSARIKNKFGFKYIDEEP